MPTTLSRNIKQLPRLPRIILIVATLLVAAGSWRAAGYGPSPVGLAVVCAEFAPAATARSVTVAVAQEDGQWLVTGLNCVAVPGWPPTWPPVTANLED